FFFQAEDGIRDKLVTGVQTCALPISVHIRRVADDGLRVPPVLPVALQDLEDFHLTGSSEPGEPPRLAAWIKPGAREWSAVREEEIGRASRRERVKRTGVAGVRSHAQS